MKHKIQILVVIVLLNYISILLGVNTGSPNNLSAQGLVNYSNGGANTILPGALMNAGFTMTVGSLLTWNSFFPVLGPVTLNGLMLSLSRDFYMAGNATLVNGGTFACNGFSVVFPHGNTSFTIGTSASTFNGGNVSFNSPISLNTTLNFGGICILDGNGNVIDCGSAGKIAVGAGASLLIKNAVLQAIGAGQLFCFDNVGSLTLQNVTIIQDAIYSFSQGILSVLNDVEITGSSVFAFQSTNSLIINSFSTLFFDVGSTFSYDTTNASLLTFADSSSELFLHGATLSATGTGIVLTKGTVSIDQNSFFASTGTLGVSIGNCSSAGDFSVNLLPDAQLTVNQGVLSYRNVNAASFNMFNTQTLLAMGAGTTLNLYRSLTGLGSVIFGNNVTLGTGPSVTLGMNSLQLGALNFTTLPSC